MNCPKPSVRSCGESELANLARILLILVMAVAAVLTVLTHIAQITGISFSLYATVGVCATTIALCLVFWKENIKQAFGPVIARPMVAVSLLACCLLGSLLSLVSHRFDPDDSLYVPNVIYYLEHPAEPMSFEYHFFDSGDKPFISYHWGTSLPFEYAQGIVAHISASIF